MSTLSFRYYFPNVGHFKYCIRRGKKNTNIAADSKNFLLLSSQCGRCVDNVTRAFMVTDAVKSRSALQELSFLWPWHLDSRNGGDAVWHTISRTNTHMATRERTGLIWKSGCITMLPEVLRRTSDSVVEKYVTIPPVLLASVLGAKAPLRPNRARLMFICFS